MAPKNPDLVPTLVTNKNGVKTTVYRKPPQATGASLRLPSAPRVTGTGSSEMLRADTLTKPDEVSDENMELAFDAFFGDNPDLRKISQRLITTGTPTGQRLVLERLSRNVGNIAEYFQRSGAKELGYSTSDDGFVRSDLVKRWAYGNVREDAGLSTDAIEDDDVDQVTYMKSFATMSESPYDEISEEEHRRVAPVVEKYWRGFSALALCCDPDVSNDDTWDNFHTFIPWAAEHEDIGKVIRAAKELNTIKVTDLMHHIDATDAGVHGSLTEGWV